ncbi:MAG TPA: hypothetical protein PLL54_03895 [Dermatophilaceae bacterium]|nr:hypothetical protein [Dermatophilaceae bacterium]
MTLTAASSQTLSIHGWTPRHLAPVAIHGWTPRRGEVTSIHGWTPR